MPVIPAQLSTTSRATAESDPSVRWDAKTRKRNRAKFPSGIAPYSTRPVSIFGPGVNVVGMSTQPLIVPTDV